MKTITFTEKELSFIIKKSVKAGVNLALTELGMKKAYFSKAEAYRVYGRKLVDRWLREKLIKRVKDGTNTSNIRLSRIELEAVAMTSNRMSWYSHYVPEEE